MEVIARSSTTDSEPGRQARPITPKRAADALLVMLFLLGITAPLLGVRIGQHGWDVAAPAENRRMAQEPQLLRLGPSRSVSAGQKIKALAHFPGEFKYYLSDHFGFRSLLIRMHGLIMVRMLGTTSNHAVTLGSQGWLYLANDGSTDDWRNLDPFTDVELAGWRSMLEKRQAFCAKIGIPYIFVVAPSKYDIYPQFMPQRLNRVGEESRLDQLVAYLKTYHSPVEIVDLRKPLLAALPQGVRLFQKTDTHWNDRGAWIGYQAIMHSVQAHGIGNARALPLSGFTAITINRPGMDLAGLLGLNDLMREESLDLVPRTAVRLPHVEQNDVEPITVDGDGPRVVMFRDSFMTIALPFVAESFGRGVYLWEDGFDQSLINAEHPDVVIQEIAQRKFMRPLDDLEKIQPLRLVGNKWRLAHPIE
jgi:hypothetical protein